MPERVGGKQEAFRPALEKQGMPNIAHFDVVLPESTQIGIIVGGVWQSINFGVELMMVVEWADGISRASLLLR
jgi:hypothetical protein